MASMGQSTNITARAGLTQALLPDPALLGAIFMRRSKLFAGVSAFVLSAVVAAVVLAPHVYETTASVLIKPMKEDPTGAAAVVPGLPADTNVVDTQARLIDSPSVALMVVRDLHLTENKDYAAAAPAGAPVGQTGMTDAENRAVTTLLKNVSVKRSGLTYVIDITAKAHSDRLAADIANSFARSYIALGLAGKQQDTSTAASYVAQNADKLREQALRDDQAVQSYMVAHNLMSADGASGATLAERQISDLTTQIAQARATLAQEQGRYNAAVAQVGRGGGADVNAVLSSETIRNLRAQEAQVSGQLATLEARYGDLYPDVISARSNLADIRAHIAAERDRILSGLRANVQVAQSGLASLEASYNAAHGQLASNNTALVGLQDLQRKADASKAVYSAFLQRAKETAAQTQAPTADATLSTPASVPDLPVWPNIPLAIVLGALGSMVFGVIAIAIAEYLDRSVRSRGELETLVGVRYAGSVPDLRRVIGKNGHRPEGYVLSKPYSMFAEALRNLAAFVMLGGRGASQVIAITSSLPREGKTTLSVCLARALARSGRNVLLVDGDFRRHSATTIFAPELAGQADDGAPLDSNWHHRLIKDAETGLSVLPATGSMEKATQITLEEVQALYGELRKAFDVVIVDTAPVLGLAETRLLTQAADAVLLAVRWSNTSSRAALAAARLLEEVRANVVGGVLTMIDSRQYAASGEGDSYIYHKRFTKYYVN